MSRRGVGGTNVCHPKATSNTIGSSEGYNEKIRVRHQRRGKARFHRETSRGSKGSGVVERGRSIFLIMTSSKYQEIHREN